VGKCGTIESSLKSVRSMSLPPEDPNDPFDRQRCIKGWTNSKLEDQVCFVLGTGGLGCTVAFTLARLGVKRIILLDRDKVETSNLNRQILFSKSDVGREKVHAAADGIKVRSFESFLF
jgi:molybdopterin/thiamine biosynthesis adenylyltransferase